MHKSSLNDFLEITGWSMGIETIDEMTMSEMKCNW